MTTTHAVTGQTPMDDHARHVLREEVIKTMAAILRARRTDEWQSTDESIARSLLNCIDMDELVALAGYTVTAEWRVVSRTGDDHRSCHTEVKARRWAEQCNGAPLGDPSEVNTYMIDERPFHVEHHTVLTSPWAPPLPLDLVPMETESFNGSHLFKMRMDANAENYDDVYPGFRENWEVTRAEQIRRGPHCDICYGAAIFSEGLGWCHLKDGRNVLPHQDDSGHEVTVHEWSAL